MSDLTKKVFRQISQRFTSRARDIARFAKTHYSFEEWCNWEAFVACSGVSGWKVSAKPRYFDLGLRECRDFADLLIEGQREKGVIVEIGLVHDGTGNKWITKLNNDSAKLCRVRKSGVEKLHLFVLVSHKGRIEASEEWLTWFDRVNCWKQPTDLSLKCKLGSKGQMIVKGFVV